MLQFSSAQSQVSPRVDTAQPTSEIEEPEELSRAVEIGLLRGALLAALETIPVPAAILTASGAVRYANQAARELLKWDRRAFVGAAGGRGSPDDPAAAFFVQPLGVAHADHALVVHRAAPDPGPAALRWRRRFHLTGRQTVILEHLARGLASKSIAEMLACSEKTVAFHVSSIFDKTGVDSRAALVARFWTER